MAPGRRAPVEFAAGRGGGVGFIDVVGGHSIPLVIVIMGIFVLLVPALRPGLVGMRG
jgi:hypothetical protein